MKTSLQLEGDWAYFVLEDLDEAYQGRCGVADALGLYLYFWPTSPYSYGALVPAAHPHLHHAYENFRRSVGELFAQKTRQQPVPWEQALLEWLRRAERQGLDWWLTGSAALAVRGAAICPGDIDIIVADADAPRAEALLADGLIQPMRPMPGWAHNSWGRAFLGAGIDLSGGVPDRADQPFATDHGPAAAQRLETVSWHGYTFRVPPLDLYLRVTEARGLGERLPEIERLLAWAKRP